ncbi:hypothetical protein DPMN_132793 [Dreissena polymorpha]|uniref:Uncharacterized protein n=1 Tax=Dreissena polymorpha TaxID=45954 RepID=A0A9D4FWS2_DREPO|nr:hypothetical protein DPMN_132793 [Dreissena polymorpha]
MYKESDSDKPKKPRTRQELAAERQKCAMFHIVYRHSEAQQLSAYYTKLYKPVKEYNTMMTKTIISCPLPSDDDEQEEEEEDTGGWGLAECLKLTNYDDNDAMESRKQKGAWGRL